ncbi:MAG: VWA domain-containing protein [Verrucomicrobia bacterium]|nr:MAG: VWA domain-containing protein [Verrucomicrobiota bacterium]
MWLEPMYLWATAAAGFPLLLHLLSRRKTVRIYFSTLRFLQLAQKQSSRRIRLENILLWLLRTALILLIVCAFAQPYVRSQSSGNWLKRTKRDVAIVWDESFSMSYESSRRNVWEESRQAILSILARLEPGDRVSLFMAGEDPFPLIAKPSGELEKIAALVKNRKPGNTSSQLQPAILAATESLHDSGIRERELFIITDGQAVPWSRLGATASKTKTTPPASVATNAPPGTTATWPPPDLANEKYPLFLTLVGVTAPENATPIQVDVYPALLRSDIPGQVWVRVAANGPQRESSVTLFVDDKEIGHQNITLTDGKIVETSLALPPLPVGTHFARIEIPRDGLARDDQFHFLLHVKEKFRVLSVGTPQDLFFLERALNPGGRTASLETHSVTTEGLLLEKLDDYSAIFLCNAVPLPGQALLTLERYVRDGGLLIFCPGDRGQPADYANIISLPAKPVRIENLDIKAQRKTLRLTKPRDPIFDSLRLAPGAVPALAIQRVLRCDPVDKKTEVLLAADADMPFLYSRNFGRGRVLLLTVAADRAWSTLPLSPLFLPLVHQMVLAGAGQGEPPLATWLSRDIDLAPFLNEAPLGASLVGPDHNTIPLRRFINNGVTTLHAENVTEPGIYRLAQSGAETTPLLAINVPRGESDLTMLKPSEIRAKLGLPQLVIAQGKDELARMVEEHRVGKPLAEQLLWAALVVGLLEWLVANRVNRKTATLTSRMLIEASGRVHAHA